MLILRVTAWLACLACAGTAWGRSVEAHWAIDVRRAAEASPVVFRGRVVEVKPIGKVDQYQLEALARFEPDRWYRGPRPREVWVHFRWNAFRPLNHDCENLEMGSDWLVFAKNPGRALELTWDCNGVLPVSRRLGAVTGSDYLSHMEADFAAGRDDPKLSRRIWSLWWLGGLQMASSRSILRRWMESTRGVEQNWARHALARSSGDLPGQEIPTEAWRDLGLCDEEPLLDAVGATQKGHGDVGHGLCDADARGVEGRTRPASDRGAVTGHQSVGAVGFLGGDA